MWLSGILVSGHTFPGGTNDSNEGWLEISVVDRDNQVVAVGGLIEEDGHVDPSAHFYKALMLDKKWGTDSQKKCSGYSNISLHASYRSWDADVAHFSFLVPESYLGQSLTIKARLLWRKFDRNYTEFSYNKAPHGFRRFDDVPDLPVTEIASGQIELSVGSQDIVSSSALYEDWVRFNDYGIGLLIQGDTQGAARAFEMVKNLAPDRQDGFRNLARVALRDGNLKNAYSYLDSCEALKPGDAQTAWVWGVVLQEDGQYQQAAAAYRRAFWDDFPEDRASWRNLGRVTISGWQI